MRMVMGPRKTRGYRNLRHFDFEKWMVDTRRIMRWYLRYFQSDLSFIPTSVWKKHYNLGHTPRSAVCLEDIRYEESMLSRVPDDNE